MNSKHFKMIVLLLLASAVVFAGDSYRAHDYDVLNYRIEIAPDFNQKSVQGNVTLTVKALQPGLETVQVDAEKFTVHSIKLNDKTELQYTNDEKSLIIRLPRKMERGEPFDISVSYSATPEKGLYFIGPNEAYPDTPKQIWSQGEGEDNHYWIPCYDNPNDKATWDMIVETDDGATAISNGRLIEKKQLPASNGTRFVYRQAQPASAYLISLIIGRYQQFTDYHGDLPVEYFVYPSHTKADAMRSFGKTPQMIDFFEKFIGYKYPYPKYAQTIINQFMYGGMENVSATTQTDRTMHDERAHQDSDSDGLVAHELAHQWWGDLVTCRNWDEMWINEGFATYFTDLWEEHDRGQDEFRYSLYRKLKRVSGYELTEPRHIQGEKNWGHYVLGSSILHMLRFNLGDDLFKAGMNRFAHDYAFSNADSYNLKQSCEDASGMNLSDFFDQWVFGAGIPEFEVAWTFDAKKDVLKLDVKQVQDSLDTRAVFKMPVAIQIGSGAQLQNEKINITQREQTFEIACKEKPDFVDFDYGPWYLKKLTMDRGANELAAMITHSDNAAGRIAAIEQAAGKFKADLPSKLQKVIENALEEDAFYGVRVTAAGTLGKYKNDNCKEALLDQLDEEKNSKVRIAIVKALGHFDGEAVSKALRNRMNSDDSYYVRAAAVKSLASLKPADLSQIIDAALSQDSWSEVVRMAALQVIDKLPEAEAITIAEKYSRYGAYPGLRRRAVQYLSKIAKSNSRAVEILKTVAQSDDHYRWRPAMSAVYALSKLKDPAIDEFIKNLQTAGKHPYVRAAAKRIAEQKPEDENAGLRALQSDIRDLKARTEKVQRKIDKLLGS